MSDKVIADHLFSGKFSHCRKNAVTIIFLPSISFSTQENPEFNCSRTGRDGRDGIILPRTGEKEIMQLIKITARLTTRIRKKNQLSKLR